jgi:SAM-dependent methyltransferase
MNKKLFKNWYLPQGRLFDLNYLKVYEKKILTPERTLREVNFIEKVLKLKPPKEILDIPCGAGRHSIEFAKRKYRITGLDINPIFLNIAKKRAQKAKLKIDWVLGDMRKIPFEEKFDVAIMLFTSFGYFDDKDNQEVFFQISKALKKKGNFVLDVNNPYFLISNFQPRDFVELKGMPKYLMEREFDFVEGRLNEKRIFIFKNGKVQTNYLSIRMYTLPELISMGEKAGLFLKDLYGDYQFKKPDINTNRWILIFRKSN